MIFLLGAFALCSGALAASFREGNMMMKIHARRLTAGFPKTREALVKQMKMVFLSKFYVSGQISIIPKPELRGFWGSSLIKPPFRVTSADVAIICPDVFFSCEPAVNHFSRVFR